MGDGTFKELKILALARSSVQEYTWGEDRVRFELSPDPDGCRQYVVMLPDKHAVVTYVSNEPSNMTGGLELTGS